MSDGAEVPGLAKTVAGQTAHDLPTVSDATLAPPPRASEAVAPQGRRARGYYTGYRVAR